MHPQSTIQPTYSHTTNNQLSNNPPKHRLLIPFQPSTSSTYLVSRSKIKALPTFIPSDRTHARTSNPTEPT
ncbi:hypothetical protein BofuT4_uP081550.1 [Botrytis cinerea T4]|uniref:Uncharacterized protein n=1 Tax=Botryotinia fuckeliana (strain T4) TaxID=999810 RepID=G2YK48_BOTF4|nr:hypothetical protein BofuT4_uP081550.1 [Botrytis cinerea T4]